MLQWVKDNRGKILVLLVIKIAFLLWVPLTHAGNEEMEGLHFLLSGSGGETASANWLSLGKTIDTTGYSYDVYQSSTNGKWATITTGTTTTLTPQYIYTLTVGTIQTGSGEPVPPPQVKTLGSASACSEIEIHTIATTTHGGNTERLYIQKLDASCAENTTGLDFHTVDTTFSRDARWIAFVFSNVDTDITTINSYSEAVSFFDDLTYGFDSVNNTTRILSFTPEDNATTTSPVQFDLVAYIAEEDIGTFSGVNITLHNIDQNILFFDFLSQNDIYLLQDRNIQTSGYYYFSTSTALDDGNYRIEACISRSYLGGFILNPFSDVSECVSHQFIVGSSTFIGNISQGLWGETNDFYAGLTATSSEALAQTCNPLDGNFGVRECLAFLFVPDASSMGDTFDDLKSAVLMKFPWGYATRFVTILTSSPTTTLPAFSVTLRTGAGSDVSLRSDIITFDPGDMIAGGGALLESIEDPIYGMTLRDVAEPMVQFTFAIALLLVIVNDIMKMGHNDREGGKSREGSKLS